ncbi:hypothetical protein ACFL1R_09290 [Candidatus Latescibacterota bacterium]
MDDYILNLKNKYSEELGVAALGYLETGLELFHKHRRSDCSCSQTALGNIGMATELVIKSYIAAKNLGCIFKDIPPEMRIILSAPESIPPFFKWGKYSIDIRSGKYETLNFDDCILCFYILFPQMKQLLLPHISFFSKCRKQSLHFALSSLNLYDFERIVYGVLQIVMSLSREETIDFSWYYVTDNDKEFLQNFESKRVERVKLTIEKAKENLGEVDIDRSESLFAHDWESYVTTCPVCTSNGLLEGYTEMAIGEDEDGSYPMLDFFGISFHCEECGLILNDIEELKLARMNILYDRSNELDRWFEKHEDFTGWFLDRGE